MIDSLLRGDSSTVPLNLPGLLLALGLTFVAGQLIAWVYVFTHSGLSYSRSFVGSLVVLPVLVCILHCHKWMHRPNRLSLLHRLKQPTLFPRDRDFWKAKLCHPRYALVYMDIPEDEGLVAAYIRRLLRHPEFDTNGKRLGKVIHVHQTGVKFWQRGTRTLKSVEWETEV